MDREKEKQQLDSSWQNDYDIEEHNNSNMPDDNNTEEKEWKRFQKFDKTLLLLLLTGIAFVYLSMLPLNAFIFQQVADVKTGFYISLVISNFLFLLLILILLKFRDITWSEAGWIAVKPSKAVIHALQVWGITWLFYIAYLLFLSGIGVTPPENELSRLLTSPSTVFLILNIILIAVVAPIVEETIFRGMLLGSLRTYMGTWTAIIVSAAIFSALHLDLIGFFTRFVLGIGLGYLYIKNESIVPSILLHGFNNLLAVLVVAVFS